MAMVVQHNLTAMNSNRQLGITTGAQAKSAEKLSSGFRINRAADDAAGLKISEKMRSQIRGLNKASSNAQDGISLIQTAEGALNEAHSILQRMNELAVQGANDPNQTIDREAINEELNALTEEINRISQTTQFNKQNLLDGTFKSKNLQVGANTYQKIEITIDNMNAAAIGLTSFKYGDVKVSVTPGQAAVSGDPGLQKGSINKGYEFNGKVYSAATSAQKAAASVARNDMKTVSAALQFTASVNGKNFIKASTKTWSFATVSDAAFKSALCVAKKALSKEAMLEYSAGTGGHLGSHRVRSFWNGRASIEAKAAIDSIATCVDTRATAKGADVTTYEAAQKTISMVQAAINKVSSQRSALGALQNRLEHTVANLDNVAENTQAAESRIRDTDMASEMVEYSKNNILAQAGQSMLAQSNQSTQGVLSLLG